ncbi:MAG TPA: DJ-1/PfpI family protein [Ideonella sp.]|nr:DJ-1/PfpI family protein [Ideonella sp.]
MTCTVGIFIFDRVEVLDFAGPYEVFTTASRVSAREHPAVPEPFRVVTVARSMAPVRARAGLSVLPDHALQAHPPLELLVVPGGVVADEVARPEVIAWIAACARSAQVTASVCTGAFLLAQAGLLDGRRVTTHWEDIAELQASYPRLTVLAQQRWVDEGAVVTSAGISAGIDMSLHLVERLAGRELALQTARQLEFDWAEKLTQPP